MLTSLSFAILGCLATLGALFMVTRRLPVTAAIALIVVMMLLAGMYGVIGAHFAAAAQIIVYAGAIMVVFVFVIMLLNVPMNEIRYGRVTIFEWFFIVLGIVAAVFLGTTIGQGFLSAMIDVEGLTVGLPPYFAAEESVRNVSSLMFTEYLWAFELTSFLIIASIVGAVVIAKKNKGARNHVDPR